MGRGGVWQGVETASSTLDHVLEYLAGGMTEDQILADFPSINGDDIRACFAFAAAHERRVTNSVA